MYMINVLIVNNITTVCMYNAIIIGQYISTTKVHFKINVLVVNNITTVCMHLNITSLNVRLTIYFIQVKSSAVSQNTILKSAPVTGDWFS